MVDKDLISRFIREQIVEQQPEFLEFPGTKAEKMPKELLRNAASERGLTLWEDPDIKHRFEFKDAEGNTVGHFRALYTSANKTVATVISANKDLSKSFFDAAGVPTPSGISFGTAQFSVAKAYMSRQTTPMVLKPAKGNAGQGVVVGIKSVKELDSAFRSIRGSDPHERFVLEEFVDGIDLRVYVVHGRVIAAASRIPAHVIGNGSDTIDLLIASANKVRARHPHHRAFPLQPDWKALQERGVDGSYVPQDGEVVVLNYVFNIHQGGYCLDVTDELSEGVKDLAIAATEAVPGTEVAGVDIYVQSLTDSTGAVVLELNHHGNFMIHHFPAYGKPRDVANAIVGEIIRQFEESHLSNI